MNETFVYVNLFETAEYLPLSICAQKGFDHLAVYHLWWPSPALAGVGALRRRRPERREEEEDGEENSFSPSGPAPPLAEEREQAAMMDVGHV